MAVAVPTCLWDVLSVHLQECILSLLPLITLLLVAAVFLLPPPSPLLPWPSMPSSSCTALEPSSSSPRASPSTPSPAASSPCPLALLDPSSPFPRILCLPLPPRHPRLAALIGPIHGHHRMLVGRALGTSPGEYHPPSPHRTFPYRRRLLRPPPPPLLPSLPRPHLHVPPRCLLPHLLTLTFHPLSSCILPVPPRSHSILLPLPLPLSPPHSPPSLSPLPCCFGETLTMAAVACPWDALSVHLQEHIVSLLPLSALLPITTASHALHRLLCSLTFHVLISPHHLNAFFLISSHLTFHPLSICILPMPPRPHLILLPLPLSLSPSASLLITTVSL